VENKYYTLKSKDGEVICPNMAIADNIFSRLMGLMFSESLPGCDGLLISPCNSIHTFFMLYSLDVVFLDRNFKVVKAVYDLRPWRLSWIYFKAHQVLEMKAGTLKKDLKSGDQLEAICIS
jgi:uncharacterized membrane protein (UPF0127 family)